MKPQHDPADRRRPRSLQSLHPGPAFTHSERVAQYGGHSAQSHALAAPLLRAHPRRFAEIGHTWSRHILDKLKKPSPLFMTVPM